MSLNTSNKIILVSGLPGSGKSTLAEGIAKRLRYPMFSVDPIESAILRSGINRSFETGLAAYLVAEALAGEQLRMGLSVIIDAVSGVKEARDMWLDLSARFHAQRIVIECVLDRDLHKKRIEARIRGMPGIPEVTWNDVENRRKEYLPWEEERLIVDTAQPVENYLEKILPLLQK